MPIDEQARRGFPRIYFIIGGVVFALLAVFLFLIPFSASAVGTYKLSPSSTTVVTAPRSGTLASVDVTEKVVTEKGAVLAKWNLATTDAKIAAIEANLGKARQKLRELTSSKRSAADAALTKAKAVKTRVDAQLQRARASAKGKRSSAVARLTRQANAAEATLAKATKHVASFPKRDDVDKEVKLFESQLAAAKDEKAHVDIVAPLTGQVASIKAAPGVQLEAGAELMTLETIDPLDVVVTSRKGLGNFAELTIGKQIVKVKLDATGRGSIDNRQRIIDAHAQGPARIELSKRPLLP